jgi:hypothetical protein
MPMEKNCGMKLICCFLLLFLGINCSEIAGPNKYEVNYMNQVEIHIDDKCYVFVTLDKE